MYANYSINGKFCVRTKRMIHYRNEDLDLEKKPPIPETELRFWKRRIYFNKEKNAFNGLPSYVYYSGISIKRTSFVPKKSVRFMEMSTL